VCPPDAGPGEVLVRIRAASINARDQHVMRGEPRLARLLDRSGLGLRRPRVATRGTDLAGTVEGIGDGMTRRRAGHRVFGEDGHTGGLFWRTVLADRAGGPCWRTR